MTLKGKYKERISKKWEKGTVLQSIGTPKIQDLIKKI